MAIREAIEADIRKEREFRDNPDIVSIMRRVNIHWLINHSCSIVTSPKSMYFDLLQYMYCVLKKGVP